MGGRGAGSSLPTTTPGGGGSGKSKWSTAPNVQGPSTLKDALGKKGRAMSIERAALGANPYYSSNYKEFSENCQRAVVAYELRRRGYNVTAQPTYKGDVLPYANVNGKGQARWQGAFQGAKSENIGSKRSSELSQNVDSKMASFGEGSRAVIGVQWKSGGGHVINVERKNGKTIYVDAQVGKKYNASDLFSAVKPSSLKIVRTDNLRVSDRAKKSVEQAGSRS